MRQAGVYACLIIRGLCLVVELQRKLNIPRTLGTGNLPHCRSKAHVRSVGLHVVERVQEVGSKLQPEAFRHLEVFMETQIHVSVMWAAKSRELRGAIAESPNGRVGEVAIIAEPLEAARSGERCLVDGSFPGDCWEAIAIGARTARIRARFIRGSVNRHGEAGAEGNDRANRPASDGAVHHLVRAVAKLLAAAKGKFINGVGGNDVGSVVIARRPLRLGIVDVLPVCRGAQGVVPCAIVAGAIGHALGVSVGHLILQAVTRLLLQDSLQRVVHHGAVRLGAARYRGQRAEECWVLRKERAGGVAWWSSASRVGKENALRVGERHHQVRAALPDVSNLEGGIFPELVLDGQVPLIVKSRLNVRIPEVKNSASEAGVVQTGARRRRGRNAVCSVRTRQGRVVVVGIELSWCERWVLRQAQVRARTFEVRGDCERTANRRLAAEESRSPGKTQARLEVLSSVGAIVERPAGAALVGVVNIPGREVIVVLLVVHFHPGSKRLVAQTEIQGQALGESPCVRSVDADNIVGLCPRFAGGNAAANVVRKAQHEVRAAVSSTIAGTADSVAGKAAVKFHEAKFAVVTSIKGLDDIVIELAAELERVPVVRPG